MLDEVLEYGYDEDDCLDTCDESLALLSFWTVDDHETCQDAWITGRALLISKIVYMIAPVGVTTIALSSTEAWMQKTLAFHVTIAERYAEPSSPMVTTSALFALRIVMTIGLTLPPIELWTAVWAIHWVPARLSARTTVPTSMSARQIVRLAGMTLILILLPSEP